MNYMRLRVKGVDSFVPAIIKTKAKLLFLPVLHCIRSCLGCIRTNGCNLKHIYKRNMKHTYFSSHASAERNAEPRKNEEEETELLGMAIYR